MVIRLVFHSPPCYRGPMVSAVVVEVSIEIAAPPEAVWDRLVDWENLGLWMKEAWEFRVTSPEREGVGVVAQARVRIAGITTLDTVVVSRWEPPEWFEIEHRGWVGGRGLMQARRTPSGTYLWWRESLEPPLGGLGGAGMAAGQPGVGGVLKRGPPLLKDL